MTGIYVKTIGEEGEAKVTLHLEGAKPKTVTFTVCET